MHTFADLVWVTHPNAIGAKLSKLFFPNGYGISVAEGLFAGGFPFSSPGHFEIAVLRGNKNSYKLVYDTPVTSDVEVMDTEDEVTSFIQQVENLPSCLTN